MLGGLDSRAAPSLGEMQECSSRCSLLCVCPRLFLGSPKPSLLCSGTEVTTSSTQLNTKIAIPDPGLGRAGVSLKRGWGCHTPRAHARSFWAGGKYWGGVRGRPREERQDGARGQGRDSTAAAGAALEGAPLSLTLGTPHPIPAAPPRPRAFLQPGGPQGAGEGSGSPLCTPGPGWGSRAAGECWGQYQPGGPSRAAPSNRRESSVRGQEGEGGACGSRSRSGDIQAGGETEPAAPGTATAGGHRQGPETPAAPRPAGRKGPEGHGAGQGWERQRGVGRKVLGHPRSPGS